MCPILDPPAPLVHSQNDSSWRSIAALHKRATAADGSAPAPLAAENFVGGFDRTILGILRFGCFASNRGFSAIHKRGDSLGPSLLTLQRCDVEPFRNPDAREEQRKESAHAKRDRRRPAGWFAVSRQPFHECPVVQVPPAFDGREARRGAVEKPSDEARDNRGHPHPFAHGIMVGGSAHCSASGWRLAGSASHSRLSASSLSSHHFSSFSSSSRVWPVA